MRPSSVVPSALSQSSDSALRSNTEAPQSVGVLSAGHDGLVISLMTMVQVVCISAAYVVLRRGAGVDWTAWGTAVAGGLWLAVLPALGDAISARFRVGSSGLARDLASSPLWSLAGAVILIGLGLLARSDAAIARSVLMLLGATALLFLLVRVATLRRDLWSAMLAVVSGGVLGAWMIGNVWGSGGIHPLFLEQLLAGQPSYVDTIYHSSVATMWRLFGSPSTAVDGTPYLAYHYGSHWTFAQWSLLAGVSPLSFYQLGFPILVVPQLGAAVLTLARAAAPANTAYSGRSRRVWPFLLLFGIGGFLKLTWQSEVLGVSLVTPVVSESNATGLFLSLNLIALAVYWWRGSVGHGAARLSMPGDYLLLSVLTVAIPVIGFAKVSHLMILVPAAAFSVVVSGRWRERRILAALSLTCVGALLVYRRVSVAGQGDAGAFLSPGEVAGELLRLSGGYLLPIHFAFSVLYVACRVARDRVQSWKELREWVQRGDGLDVAVLTAVVVISEAPPILINLLGNGVYFTDLQRWIAVSLLIALSPSVATAFAQSRIAAVLVRWSRGPMGGLAAMLFAAPCVALMLNIALPLKRAYARSSLPRVSNAVAGEVELPLLRSLRDLGLRSDNERRRALLYIPQSAFSTLQVKGLTCSGAPFLAIAVSGMALLDAFPRPPCDVGGLGYPAYPKWQRSVSTARLGDNAMCARTRQLGFAEVVALDSVGSQPRRIRCQP